MRAPFSETINNRSIAAVFSLNSERYVIPSYQRSYVWGADQLNEMMKDIIHSFRRKQEYSFGSIMVAKSYGPDNNAIYYVVDGQQRLTSFMFLLQALAKWTVNPNFEKHLKSLFWTYDHYGNEVSSTIVDEEFNNIANPLVVDSLLSILVDSKIDEEDLSGWIIDEIFISVNVLHYDSRTQKDEIYEYCLNRFITMNSKGMKLVAEEVENAKKVLKEVEMRIFPDEVPAHNLPSVQTGKIYAVISKAEFETHFVRDAAHIKPKLVAISITDPDSGGEPVAAEIMEGFQDSLQMRFWDLEEDYGNYKTITKREGFKLREFILKNKDATFVIHCMAGISRSAGIACAIECLTLFDGDVYAYQTSNSEVKNHFRYSPNLTVFDKIVYDLSE